MGGKALLKLGIQVDRIPSRELYEKLCDILVKDLRQYYARVEALPQFSTKKTFGDIDILVEGEQIKPFTPQYFVRNGDYLSFGYSYKEYTFQVDLIHVQASTFDFAMMNLFSDMSACIGGILKLYDLKFSHDGLWYIGQDISQKLLLTTSVDTFLSFLQLPAPFPFDVKSHDEFFGYLLTSRFPVAEFIMSRYSNDKLKQKSKNFKNQRECFVKFVEYIVANHHMTTTFSRLSSRELVAFFGVDVLREYDRRVYEHTFNREYHAKFNGKIVMKFRQELREKQVGTFMKHFEETFTKQEIMSMDEETLYAKIRDLKHIT